MTENPAALEAALPRLLGAVEGARPGPLVVVTAGVHGNEPAGVFAARRVLTDLARFADRLRGRVVALSGNRAAMRHGLRSIEHDLNRLWSDAEIARARALAPSELGADQAELLDMLRVLEAELARASHGATFLDLHSTSGAGPPFALVAHPVQGRDLAQALEAPLLLGLERILGGTLLEWFTARGHRAAVLEGGQNEAPSTVDHHESAIWLFLAASGALDEREIGTLDGHRARVRASVRELPRVLEISYRHELQAGEPFRMLPGYANFSPVRAGELLAHSGEGFAREVRAPQTATLIMPRYQGQGLDGFFLGRPIGA